MGAKVSICEDSTSAFKNAVAFSINTDRRQMWYHPTILSYNCTTKEPQTGDKVQTYKRIVNWYFVMLVSVVGLWLLFHVVKAMMGHRGGGYTAAYV